MPLYLEETIAGQNSSIYRYTIEQIIPRMALLIEQFKRWKSRTCKSKLKNLHNCVNTSGSVVIVEHLLKTSNIPVLRTS